MNVDYKHLNTMDVAAKFKVSDQTIYNWIGRGLLHPINVSDGTNRKRYMFRSDEIDNFKRPEKVKKAKSKVKAIKKGKERSEEQKKIIELQAEIIRLQQCLAEEKAKNKAFQNDILELLCKYE